MVSVYLGVLEDGNASALTASLWFGDEGLMFLHSAVGLEVAVAAANTRDDTCTSTGSGCSHSLSRHNPGAREDVVFFGEQFLHPSEVSAEEILSAYLTHPREVVDLLQEKMKKWPLQRLSES